jgi:maltose O-acetyltransferase
MFEAILARLFSYMERSAVNRKEKDYRRRFSVHPTARLGYLPHIIFKGNIEIGAHSYINSGRISTGKNSNVKIGEWCAIGHNVTIHAVSHDPDWATGLESERPIVEGSISIGNNVWIGSNVFIRPGVSIGNNCVIGVNSVVTKDIPENAIVGGIPAKIIRFRRERDEKKNSRVPQGV